ncbi:MAG: hypothetical protein AABX35_02655 [Nanoarchaeota archaeon]
MNDLKSYNGISVEDIASDVVRGYREAKDPELSKTIYLSGRNNHLVRSVAAKLNMPGTNLAFNGATIPRDAYRVNLDAVVSLLASAKQRSERI